MMRSTFPEMDNISTILLVEDDSQVAAALSGMLRLNGWQVETVASAEKATEVLADRMPDVVLLDLCLPGRSGHDLLFDIRTGEATRLLPVIMLTGGATRQDRLKALSAGVTDFLAKPCDVAELSARVAASLRLKALVDCLEEADHMILSLARVIDVRDRYSSGHSERVADLACQLGRRIGLSHSLLVTLRRGALVHDIGKVAIPDEVLHKPGSLDPSEAGIMRTHPVKGCALLEPLATLRSTLPIVRHHHERMDGSGYPDGLVGEDIPIEVRITTVVDIFDALTSDRPYRASMSRDAALRVLDGETDRGWIDARVVEHLRLSV